MGELDLVRSKPQPDLVVCRPQNTIEAVFGIEEEYIAVYLADARELTAARDLPEGVETDPAAGAAIAGEISIDLPDGDFHASIFDPKTGTLSPEVPVFGGKGTSIDVPGFVHDTVICLRRD